LIRCGETATGLAVKCTDSIRRVGCGMGTQVAGGHSVVIGLMENVIKECAEEASVPAEIASKAQPVRSCPVGLAGSCSV